MHRLKRSIVHLLLLCFLGYLTTGFSYVRAPLHIKQGHSRGFHGIESIYLWNHKTHTGGFHYIYHLNQYWHMRCGVQHSRGNLFKVLNTYHWNISNGKESFFCNMLFGLQTAYQIGQAKYNTTEKKWNIGLEFGFEFEHYLSNRIVFVATATSDVSFLDRHNLFRYHLGGGLRFTF